MIDLETIEREIDKLEHREASYRLCQRLSWLYAVRDNMIAKLYPDEVNKRVRANVGGSAFLDAANGKPYEDVLKVVDEHLETIRLLYPKTYDGVIERVKALR